MLKRLAACMVVLAAATGATAQDPLRTLQFSLDRPGPPATQYTLAITDDGAGVYVGKLAPTLVNLSGQGGEGTVIHVAPAVVKKLFAAVPMVEGGRCETHSKSIAKTGAKTLRYAGAGHDGRCEYNYSDDDRVNEATAAFEAIAETMQYGDRLQAKLRFDRLGLDAELEGLQGAVSEGRALDVENIAPVLHRILDDERVMDRVHRKAERLLEAASQPGTAAGSSER